MKRRQKKTKQFDEVIKLYKDFSLLLTEVNQWRTKTITKRSATNTFQLAVFKEKGLKKWAEIQLCQYNLSRIQSTRGLSFDESLSNKLNRVPLVRAYAVVTRTFPNLGFTEQCKLKERETEKHCLIVAHLKMFILLNSNEPHPLEADLTTANCDAYDQLEKSAIVWIEFWAR